MTQGADTTAVLLEIARKLERNKIILEREVVVGPQRNHEIDKQELASFTVKLQEEEDIPQQNEEINLEDIG